MKNSKLGTSLLIGGFIAVIVPIIIIGIVSTYESSRTVVRIEKAHIENVSKTIAGSLENIMYGRLVAIRNISYSNSAVAAAEKVAKEGVEKSRHEIALAERELIRMKNAEGDRLSSINLIDKGGTFFASSDHKTFAGTNVANREYFQKALKGTPNFVSVVISKATGRVVCTGASPIYASNGKDIAGVAIMAVELSFFADTVERMKIGKAGYVYIIDSNGLYITHPAKENILKVNISQVKGMESVASLAGQRKEGVVEYTLDGIDKVAAVNPVEITGWTVVSTIPTDELYAPARFTRNMILAIGIVFLILALVFFYFFARNLTRPLGRVVDAARQIALGDLSVQIAAETRQDEIGMLFRTFTQMILSLREKAQIAGRIAVNDLTVKAEPISGEDVLGNAFSAMVENLRKQIREIMEGVGVLAASGSEIMASVSQLTSGAAETSIAVTETTATVEEVKQTAEVASQKARHVSELGQKMVETSKAGLKSIEDTISGMNRIRDQMESVADMVVRLSEQSQSIGEIIASVNDLAEQSNLLAVNASIEAAKAGEQGRGFAVVAQEIRSLAEQSKQATTQVRSILFDVQKAISSAVMATEQGTKAVEEGERLSTRAGESIEVLADSVTEATNAAIQIAASSQQQLAGMDQVAMAMENIKEAAAQMASSTKQTEGAVHDLHNLGQRLQEIVKGYKV
jgi:methyl-accepting chemotaxis protein